MKAYEVLDALKAFSPEQREVTVDTLKAGDPEKDAKKVAFCHIATYDVIAQAKEWGADVLITHEPTYYDHLDNYTPNIVSEKKKAAVEASGLTIFRFHDHAHLARPDIIHTAFLRLTGLKGEYDGSRILTLASPMSAREMSELITSTTGIKHPRIFGSLDAKVTKVALALGACGDMAHNLVLSGEADMVIAGEICEWRTGEYFRDASQMGLPFSLIAIGHVCCERYGMQLASEMISEKFPELETKYFECGDLIQFID